MIYLRRMLDSTSSMQGTSFRVIPSKEVLSITVYIISILHRDKKQLFDLPDMSAMVRLHKSRFVIFLNLRRVKIMRHSNPLPISPDINVGTYKTINPTVNISEPCAGPSICLSSKLRNNVSLIVRLSVPLQCKVEVSDVRFIVKYLSLVFISYNKTKHNNTLSCLPTFTFI